MDKPTVLLVDDNEATCTLITALLQREFVVETAGDGIEALELLKTNNYAAILLDLRMPQLDGFAVLEHLEKHSPTILRRVIILTAALTKGEISQAKQYAIHSVVPKPFEVEELIGAVKRCAGESSGDGPHLSDVICQSAPVFLLLAEVIRQFR